MNGLATESRGSTPDKLPTYARVEDITRYVAGGFHPIHLGDRIGPDDRFEVHHKLGYSDASTVWLCLDRNTKRRVGVKVLRAEESTESHPDVVALRLFKKLDRLEVQWNRLFPVEEHFWIEGPNGHHLCLVVQVLGPAVSFSLPGMDLDSPDFLTDICFQASQSLRYLHDNGICHGDFRPDHIRMQLNSNAMTGEKIYDLFGEPKIWHLNDSQTGSEETRPRYLVEPANMVRLEEKYRTGEIGIDSFSSSHHIDDPTNPRVFDTHHTAPEVRLLNRPSSMSSDIWSLGSTIYLIRTAKLLTARLPSRSSLVAWLSCVYGPFPRHYWREIGTYLSDDSTVPVFSGKIILPKLPSNEELDERVGVVPAIDSKEWGEQRKEIITQLLGGEETPRSMYERELLQEEKDRSKYRRIKLPNDLNSWAMLQGQRKAASSLLHEDLSADRQWYQETEPSGEGTEDTPKRLPGAIDEATFQRLNGLWGSGYGSGPAIKGKASSQKKDSEAEEEEEKEGEEEEEEENKTVKTGKKRRLEQYRKAHRKAKKPRLFIAEHTLRDRVECVEQDDGMTKFSYRIKRREVNILAGLLRGMLMTDPNGRVCIEDVLQHEWFDGSWARLTKS